MATIDVLTMATKVAAHNLLQATGQTGTNAYPFSVNSGDVIPSSVDCSAVNLATGHYTFNGGATGQFKATLDGVVADNTRWTGAVLDGASIQQASFKNADFKNASLRLTAIGSTNFDGSRMDQVNLYGAGATGTNATFKDVDFRNAKLTGLTLGTSNPFV